MKAAALRRIAMLAAPAVLALPIESQPSLHLIVYTSTDGSFQISYPGDFQVCTAGKMDPCSIQSYIPPCDEDAIVCVVYPQKKLEGTAFKSAAFQVREIHRPLEGTTPEGCVTPLPNTDDAERFSFVISAQHSEERIGGVLFVHRDAGGVAAGHQISVDLYRAFHRSKCYELTLRKSEGSAGNSDLPPKNLTHATQEDMNECLSGILHSYRFLKSSPGRQSWLNGPRGSVPTGAAES